MFALALGTRRGELRALHRGHFVRPAEDRSFVLFIIYSQNRQGKLPTEPYKLIALQPSTPPRDGALVLCPVRALKAYLEKTTDPSFVNNRETLFLQLNRTSSLSSYNISKLFADAVQFCYSWSAYSDAADFHTNIHQLRSISASLAYLGRTPLEHIVLSGRRKSANVFTDFYLNSLAYFSENLYSLAPLVVFNANDQLSEDL